MSRLRDFLTQNYAEHYKKANPGIDVIKSLPARIPELDYLYGDLLKPLPPGSSILDIGCGMGYLLSWLATKPGIKPVGVDLSESQVKEAKAALPDVEIHLEDGLAFLKRNPGRFGGIFCTDVLEHIPGEDGLLAWVEALFEALQPGGFLLVRVPNAANLFGPYLMYSDLTHVRLFTSLSLLQILETAGFERGETFAYKTKRIGPRVRMFLEEGLHRALFRLSGRSFEHVFATILYAKAFKPNR